jgi:hypothetical protein
VCLPIECHSVHHHISTDPKLEARIALLPLRPVDAAKLDTKITQKVIRYLNMTFSVKPYYLNQLLKHHGRELPSIQDINASQVVKGLLCSLNHHIPHLWDMAQISYAQWMCSKNKCVNSGVWSKLHTTTTSAGRSQWVGKLHNVHCQRE